MHKNRRSVGETGLPAAMCLSALAVMVGSLLGANRRLALSQRSYSALISQISSRAFYQRGMPRTLVRSEAVGAQPAALPGLRQARLQKNEPRPGQPGVPPRWPPRPSTDRRPARDRGPAPRTTPGNYPTHLLTQRYRATAPARRSARPSSAPPSGSSSSSRRASRRSSTRPGS